MKKIIELTPAQKARFGEWAEKWIDIGLSTEPADFDAATTAALKAYELCGLDKPMVILRVASPYAATIGGAYAWRLLKTFFKDQVRDQVGGQVMDQIWAKIGNQVRDQVRDQVGGQIGDQVGDKVGDKVVNQVGNQVRDQVWAQVGDKVRDKVRDKVWAQVGDKVVNQVGNQVRDQVWAQVGGQVGAASFEDAKNGFSNDGYSSMWCSFSAYVSYFRDVCGWSDPILEKFEINESLVKSCGWTWWHQNVLAISDRPSEIHLDNEGRLHAEKGPSILYRDGWSLYHWHGVKIPREWVTGEPPSAKDALKWPNIEQRRAACEIVGWKNILDQLDAKVIDEDDDEEIGTLLEVELPDSGRERFLQIRCGTGRQFALPVPQHCETALEANMWSYGLEADRSYIPEVRT